MYIYISTYIYKYIYIYKCIYIRVISIPFPTNPSYTPAWLIYNPNTLVTGNCES